MNCRHCNAALTHVFADLGRAPPSNAYRSRDDLKNPETYFPLKILVCDQCWLVQTEDYAAADEFFNDTYAYFSSTSQGWLKHAAQYVADVVKLLNLNANSFVIEIACNDGYLLKNFAGTDISVLGIEPTASTAAAAEALGIPVLREFFNDALAHKLVAQRGKADLIVGNNVFAHVPDINDFAQGLKTALKQRGAITLEFPHLLRLIQYCQFDTIYHEHFSYLSLYTVQSILAKAGLKVIDIEELPTHGGSLRVFCAHEDDARQPSASVAAVIANEESAGLRDLEIYRAFQSRIEEVKTALLAFLQKQKVAGKSIAAYGAAAKGNTLLNYAGVKPDLLPYVCDAARAKQGMYMPGSHIPIVPPEEIMNRRPDTVLILPWNIASEVKSQLRAAKDWGAQFVTAIPHLDIT